MRLLIDLVVVLCSIVVAVFIVKEDLVHVALALVGDGVFLASFLAGVFFTSVFTTAPAIAVLGTLALEENVLLVSCIGGLGAVVGDYVLFMFVRKRIVADTSALMKGPRWRRLLRMLRHSQFRRILPVLGALIIASPFPDELGLALLGLSSIRVRTFFILSFSMNAAGILLIGLIARSFTL